MSNISEERMGFIARWSRGLGSGATGTGIILVIALSWQLLTFKNPDPIGFDEEIYRFYSETLGQRGWSGLREVVHAWPEHEKLKKGPLPYRLAYIVPGMVLCRLLGEYKVSNLALLSSIFGVAFVVVAYLLLCRWPASRCTLPSHRPHTTAPETVEAVRAGSVQPPTAAAPWQ